MDILRIKSASKLWRDWMNADNSGEDYGKLSSFAARPNCNEILIQTLLQSSLSL